jgi:hypothetical protein
MRGYLVPGGRLVAQLSGKLSLFGVLNLIAPRSLGVPVVARIRHQNPDKVFAAYYHRCYASALHRLFDPWSSVEVLPRYRGGTYLAFAQPLQKAYLAYEDWAARGRDNLATHYLVTATP